MTSRRAPIAIAALVAGLGAGGWLVSGAAAEDARGAGAGATSGTTTGGTAATAATTTATADDVGAAEVPHPLRAAVDAGQHVRLDTDHGAVHVWVPAGYHADGAATIVYVHGYYTDVDQAWTNHQLPEQFALSGLDAVFIACEAPAGSRPAVSWTSMGDLLDTVFARTTITRPMGPVIAVGHSGAFRTLLTWLDYPLLDQIVLVDALYAEVEPFRAWLAASPSHRLIDVGEDTVRWTDELARAEAGEGSIEVDRFPFEDRGWPEGAFEARLLTVRSQMGHMELVTAGVALPMLLRLLPVEVLPDAPWDQPLGSLPALPTADGR
ncbi:MAG: hypothetical protein H6708_18330 [Kofleriaceae bacterium]|nr:hypothetical protein [Kofleriaceae bacterium]